MRLNSKIKEKLDEFYFIQLKEDKIFEKFKIKKDIELPVKISNLNDSVKTDEFNFKDVVINMMQIIGYDSEFLYIKEYFKITDNLLENPFVFANVNAVEKMKNEQFLESIAYLNFAILYYEYKVNLEKKNMFKSFSMSDYFNAKIDLGKVYNTYYEKINDEELKKDINDEILKIFYDVFDRIEFEEKKIENFLEKINIILDEQKKINKKLIKNEEIKVTDDNHLQMILDLNEANHLLRENKKIANLLNKKKPIIYFFLSFALFRDAKYESAYSFAKKALKILEDEQMKQILLKNISYFEDMSLLEKGKNAIDENLFYDAIKFLETISDDLKENSYEVNYYLAYARRKTFQLDIGMQNLQRAKQIFEIDVNLFAEIAAYAISYGDFTSAKKALAEGLKIDANSYHLTSVMAEYYRHLNKFDDANACEKKLEQIKEKFNE